MPISVNVVDMQIIRSVIFYADAERNEVNEESTSGVCDEVRGAVKLRPGTVRQQLIGRFQDDAIVDKDAVFRIAIIAHIFHRG